MNPVTGKAPLIQLFIIFGLLLSIPVTTQAAATPNISGTGSKAIGELASGQIFVPPTYYPGLQPYYPYANPGDFPYPFQPPVTVIPFTPPAMPGAVNFALGVNGTFLNQGLLIQQVTPGSPGAKAGLQPNDVVLKMDGVVVTNQAVYQQVLNASGGVVQLAVLRNNQVLQTVAVLTVTGARIAAPYILGVRGVYTPLGLSINKVYSFTPASRAGLKVGDVLAGINNNPLANDAQFFTILYTSGGHVALQIRRGGQINVLKVKLELVRFGVLGNFSPIGTQVELVQPATPASKTGFQPNDLIKQIDGKNVTSQATFEAALDQSQGTSLFTVSKAGAGQGVVAVELMNNSLGCWCQPAVGGMRLLNSPQGSLAQAIGLIKGDIILLVDNRPTANLNDLQTTLQHARGIMVVDYRSVVTGQILQLNVNLGNFFN